MISFRYKTRNVEIFGINWTVWQSPMTIKKWRKQKKKKIINFYDMNAKWNMQFILDCTHNNGNNVQYHCCSHLIILTDIWNKCLSLSVVRIWKCTTIHFTIFYIYYVHRKQFNTGFFAVFFYFYFCSFFLQ